MSLLSAPDYYHQSKIPDSPIQPNQTPLPFNDISIIHSDPGGNLPNSYSQHQISDNESIPFNHNRSKSDFNIPNETPETSTMTPSSEFQRSLDTESNRASEEIRKLCGSLSNSGSTKDINIYLFGTEDSNKHLVIKRFCEIGGNFDDSFPKTNRYDRQNDSTRDSVGKSTSEASIGNLPVGQNVYSNIVKLYRIRNKLSCSIAPLPSDESLSNFIEEKKESREANSPNPLFSDIPASLTTQASAIISGKIRDNCYPELSRPWLYQFWKEVDVIKSSVLVDSKHSSCRSASVVGICLRRRRIPTNQNSLSNNLIDEIFDLTPWKIEYYKGLIQILRINGLIVHLIITDIEDKLIDDEYKSMLTWYLSNRFGPFIHEKFIHFVEVRNLSSSSSLERLTKSNISSYASIAANSLIETLLSMVEEGYRYDHVAFSNNCIGGGLVDTRVVQSDGFCDFGCS